MIPLKDREKNGTTPEPDFLRFQSWQMEFRNTNLLELEVGSMIIFLWGIWGAGNCLPTSQVGFRIGCMMLPLFRGTHQIVLRLSIQSCREQFTCPTEFLNSLFWERPIKHEGRELDFLCLVTKDLGKNVYLHSSWATRSLPWPLKKSRPQHTGSSHISRPLGSLKLCYTRGVQTLQSLS